MTLSRRAAGASPPPPHAALDWRIDGYALVESQPGNGAPYTVLQNYP